jgi:hypothetical protein
LPVRIRPSPPFLEGKCDQPSFKVGPFLYDVQYSETVVDPDNRDRNISGYCSQSRCTIYIATSDRCEEFIRTTLWHEVKHAVLDITCDTDKASADAIDEEQLIQRLASLEIGVLRDNPKLVEYLLGEKIVLDSARCLR